MSQISHGAQPKEDLPPGPVAGDVIYARYRWMEDGKDAVGKKVRPCVIIKVSPDSSSIIVAPISTRSDRLDANHQEIPEDKRADCGLSTDRKSFIKFNEINRIDLPNRDEVHTHRGPDGWLTARKGRVDEETLRQVQTEIGMRTHEKTIRGVRIQANDQPSSPLQMNGVIAQRNKIPALENSQRHAPGDPVARPRRHDAIREKASQMVAAKPKTKPEKSSEITR